MRNQPHLGLFALPQNTPRLELASRRAGLLVAGFGLCVALAAAWQSVLHIAGVAPSLAAWRQWAILLLLSPLLEEWVFRRGLHDALLAWPRLARLPRIAGLLSVTNLVVALTFSGFHALSQGWLAVGVLVPALCIGWVFERNGHLRECVLLHAAFNAAWLAALWLRA